MGSIACNSQLIMSWWYGGQAPRACFPWAQVLSGHCRETACSAAASRNLGGVHGLERLEFPVSISSTREGRGAGRGRGVVAGYIVLAGIAFSAFQNRRLPKKKEGPL